MKKELVDFLMTNTPSGNEQEGINYFNNECSKFAYHSFQDNLKNSCFMIGKIDGIPFMISAHIDEISMRVQYVDENGFIYFITEGCVDPKTLLGAQVIIMNKQGNVYGVIGKKSTLIEGNERNTVNAIESLKIDAGFETKNEALKNISIGDSIVISTNFHFLSENRFTYKGLDDKVGVFIVMEVLRRLKNYPFKRLKVYGCALTQEEVGGVGAKVACRRINPSYSIDYDVTFATDDGYVSPTAWGDIKLGNGAAIGHSTDCDSDFTNEIIDIANRIEIPYQSFSRKNHMCNTSEILENSMSCKTAFIAIPLRNMHTQVEIADMRDIESIIQITIETIKKIDNA